MDSSVRWTERIESQSGDWPDNVFDFFSRVSAKLLLDLKKPFRLEGMVRQDTTPVHDAVREALGNCLAHADFMQPWSVVVEKWPGRLMPANPSTIICAQRRRGDGAGKSRVCRCQPHSKQRAAQFFVCEYGDPSPLALLLQNTA
jgi:hypothetical protein